MPSRSSTSPTTGASVMSPPVGRRLAGAAIGKHVFRVADGAVERSDQLRREALHRRVTDRRQPVGHQLCGGEDVAHVMIDLGDGKAEIGEPFLAFQRALQLFLHGGKFALGDAELVVAIARGDHRIGIVGMLRETAASMAVMRRTGRMAIRLIARKTRLAVISAMISDRTATLRA